MPRKVDPELRSRAVRLATEHRSECSSATAVRVQVAESLGVTGVGPVLGDPARD